MISFDTPHRPMLLAGAIAVCALIAPRAGAGAQATSVDDSLMVVQTIQRFVRAFNDLDWADFRTFFTDNATVFQPLPWSPLRNNGRAELERIFSGLFDTVRAHASGPPYLHIQPKDARIQMLGNVAVVTFHLGADSVPRVGRRTLVLQKQQNGSWQIVHLHASTAERIPAKPSGATHSRSQPPSGTEPGSTGHRHR